MDKREMLEGLLERGMVMVTLDARRPGVDVPRQLAEDPTLRLNLSYRFGLPLEISAWGVYATLTFGGVPHPCKLPWSAIYLIASHVTSAQFVFPSELPEELLDLAGEDGALAGIGEDEAEKGAALDPQDQPSVGKPRLALVPPVEEAEEEGSPDPGSGPTKGRPHLRRIK